MLDNRNAASSRSRRSKNLSRRRLWEIGSRPIYRGLPGGRLAVCVPGDSQALAEAVRVAGRMECEGGATRAFRGSYGLTLYWRDSLRAPTCQTEKRS